MGTRYKGTKEEVRALNAFINLTRSAESLAAAQHRRLAEDGLTLSQFGVLEALFHLGPMSQRELSEKLLKTSGDMTLVMTNLEKERLITRRRSRSDRRALEVRLSKRGQKLMERILPRHMAGITRDMSRLTARDLEELRRMCRSLGKKQDD